MSQNTDITKTRFEQHRFYELRKAIDRVTNGKCADGYVRIYRSVYTHYSAVDNFYIGIEFNDRMDDKKTGYLYGYREYVHIYTNATKVVEVRFEPTPQDAIDKGFVETPYLSKELQQKIIGVIEEWLKQ